MDVISQKHKNLTYSYTIEDKASTINQDFIVDTGATHSSMTYSLLMSLILQKIPIEYIEGCDTQFTIANNDIVDSYLCKIDNVKLYGLDENKHIVLPTFYFYVVNDNANSNVKKQNSNKLGLLGLCFLDNCEFTHRPNGNFVIKTFNYDTYKHFYTNIVRNKASMLLTDANIENLFKINKPNEDCIYECLGIAKVNRKDCYKIRHIKTNQSKLIEREKFLIFKEKCSPNNRVANIVIQESEKGILYPRFIGKR